MLTVDIGTTSAKALLMDVNSQVKATAQEFYPTHFPQPGYAEQDPMEILRAVRKIISSCSEQHRGNIRSIVLSSAMHSLIAVDKAGQPLTPMIIWSDMRSSEHAERIKNSTDGDVIYFRTGTPVHPMAPLSKLCWMREMMPDVFNSAFKFISIKELVIHDLTGRFVVDYSVASSTGIFDVHDLTWSTVALQTVGLSEDKLSTCISPYEEIRMLPQAIEVLGLSADTTVIPGASDGCLANLGSDAMQPGDMCITIGTSGAVRMTTTTYRHDEKKRIFNYRLDEEIFIAGGATNNGTVLLNWFGQNFNGDEQPDLETFVRMAMQVPAGAEELIFLPYVFGERAPYHNPDFRGVFFGLSQNHGRPHMMRALLEGICFEIRSIVDSVEEAVGKAGRILVSGGFIRSSQWVQLLADILAKEVGVCDVHDASSLGAARMGFKVWNNEAYLHHQEAPVVFYPDEINSTKYEALYGLFLRTTHILSAEFKELAAIRKSHR